MPFQLFLPLVQVWAAQALSLPSTPWWSWLRMWRRWASSTLYSRWGHSRRTWCRQRLVAQAGGGECSCTDVQTLGLIGWTHTYPAFPPPLIHPLCPTPTAAHSCPHRSNMSSSMMPCWSTSISGHEMHVKVLRKTYQHLKEVNSSDRMGFGQNMLWVWDACTHHIYTPTHPCTHANMHTCTCVFNYISIHLWRTFLAKIHWKKQSLEVTVNSKFDSPLGNLSISLIDKTNQSEKHTLTTCTLNAWPHMISMCSGDAGVHQLTSAGVLASSLLSFNDDVIILLSITACFPVAYHIMDLWRSFLSGLSFDSFSLYWLHCWGRAWSNSQGSLTCSIKDQ